MKDKRDENIVVINQKADWNNVLKQIGHYDCYHTFDYHEACKVEGETPILITYKEADILIALPLLVRPIPGTPYKDATSVYGYAGPISKNLPANYVNENFKESLNAHFLKNNYVSIFSRLNPFLAGQNMILKDLGHLTHQGKTVYINLQNNIDLQRHQYQNRLKTHINKARRSCTIKEATKEQDILEFIDIYYENMERVMAKKFYYFEKAYFEKMAGSNNFKSIILMALDNATGQTVGASQFIITNGIVQYHLSGTRNKFLHLMPTKLLIDEMRLIANQHNYKYFNLGGGFGGSTEDSLFRFKASFSKDFLDFYLWKYIVDEVAYNDLIITKGITNEANYFPKYRYTDELNRYK